VTRDDFVLEKSFEKKPKSELNELFGQGNVRCFVCLFVGMRWCKRTKGCLLPVHCRNACYW
jgi:hypothetical protein